MNTGVVSSRYAKAFLRYTREKGTSAEVCAAAQALLSDPEAAIAAGIRPEIERLAAMLLRRGRIDSLRRILMSFVAQYYESANIKLARLTTAVKSEKLERVLDRLLRESLGCDILMQTAIDPGIIGGFVLEVDNCLLDASVSSKIERIRRELLSQNAKRIV